MSSTPAQGLRSGVLALVELALFLRHEPLPCRHCFAAPGELVPRPQEELLGLAQLRQACLDLGEALRTRLRRLSGRHDGSGLDCPRCQLPLALVEGRPHLGRSQFERLLRFEQTRFAGGEGLLPFRELSFALLRRQGILAGVPVGRRGRRRGRKRRRLGSRRGATRLPQRLLELELTVPDCRHSLGELRLEILECETLLA